MIKIVAFLVIIMIIYVFLLVMIIDKQHSLTYNNDYDNLYVLAITMIMINIVLLLV